MRLARVFCIFAVSTALATSPEFARCDETKERSKTTASDKDPAADEAFVENAFFENNVRPLLVDHCIKCHGQEKQEGGLRLDTRDGLIAGGDSGPVLVEGDSESSSIISAVRYLDFEMPPSGPLDEAKIRDLEAWVSRGAYWPTHSGEGGMELRTASGIEDSDREYWAFRPLNAPPQPLIDDLSLGARVRTPVDAFVIARLHEQGLALSPDADRQTLLRRVFFDLVGVPPTPQEMEAFLADDRHDAYEQLVNRLLSDRRYGEKWARHWLDLTRYAESDGFNQDASRPTAYLYRDWVIGALNDDLPYDQFVLAQLAGDEVAPNDPQMLAATGFLRNWIYEYNQRDARTQWSNILNDITDVTGEVFFGLGIGCARCHDHKFDPILQKDYFRLQASFAAFIPRDDSLFGLPADIRLYNEQRDAWEKATDQIRRQIAVLESSKKKAIADAAYNKFPLDIRPILFRPASAHNGYEQQIFDLANRQVELEWDKIDFAKVLKGEELEQWKKLKAELENFEDRKPKPLPQILAAGTVTAEPPPLRIPGHPDSGVVKPATFEVLGASALFSEAALDSDSTSVSTSAQNRTRLAEWINARANPLPQRVIVNRMWQELFGEGIVANASDFGRLGAPPTHPELLDWLAVWFLENGRSFKELHRLLVTSSVYRQSSQPTEGLYEAAMRSDWENALLWHYPVRRLAAEQIRDAMLVASQSLKPMDGGKSEPHDSFVRSIYTLVKRNQPHPFLVAFDAPDRSSSIGRRNVTTTANQALLLSNAEWPLGLAQTMSRQLKAEGSSPEQHIEAAYRRCLQRDPNAEEQLAAIAFLKESTHHVAAIQAAGELGEQGSISTSEGALADNVPEEAGEAAAQRPIRDDPSPTAEWYRTKAYDVALADFCHVLLNCSEFLYIK